MGTDGVTFDSKFAAYEKYLKTNAKRLGLSGQEIGEQLGRYSVGLQQDQIKAENKRIGRELAREIPKNKSVRVKDNKSSAGLNVRLINEHPGIDKAKPAGNASVYSLAKNEPAGVVLHGNVARQELFGNSLRSAADNAELVSWEPVKAATNKGLFSKIGKFFKGKGGKLAIAGAAVGLAVGLYSLFKSDKKDEKPLTDKLDDLKIIKTPESNDATIANPDNKTEEKAEEKTDVNETPEVKVPDKKPEAEETSVAGETQEPDKSAPTVVVPPVAVIEKPDVDEAKNGENPEPKPVAAPVAETPKENKQAADNDKSLADNLKDQVKENNAQNKELRREIKSIRRHERLERRLENLQKRKEFKIEQQIKFEEQQALRQAKREAKASGNPERLTRLKQKQEIREIRQKGKEQIREIRFQTKQAVLEYKLSKTA